MNFSTDMSTNRLATAQGSGMTTVTSLAVSMANFKSVCFMVGVGAVGLGGSGNMYIRTSSDNSTFNDLEGSGMAYADDDDEKFFQFDIIAPREQYLRMKIERSGANSVIYGIWSFSYDAAKRPTTSIVGLGGVEIHLSPGEGTA